MGRTNRTPPHEDYKWCPNCEHFLHKDMFYKNISSKDGLQGWCSLCMKEKAKIYDARRYWRSRAMVLYNYGAKCARCGVDDIRVLELDHIDPALALYQKNELGWSNDKIFRDAVRRDYPDDYQLLCKNCNWRKRIVTLDNAEERYQWIEEYMESIKNK